LLTEFYDDLGLSFLDATALQTELREIILAKPEAFKLLTIEPGRERLPATKASALITAIEGLQDRLERSLGRDATDLFRIWCQDVFTIDPEDRPDWFCYEKTFSSWKLKLETPWHRQPRDWPKLRSEL
jgi:hypothetical protein